MPEMTVKQFSEEAIKRLCDRCADGDPVFCDRVFFADTPERAEWSHGVDMRGEVTINPEPCNAAIIHELLTEMG